MGRDFLDLTNQELLTLATQPTDAVAEILARAMYDYQVFGMQSMKRCVVDAWEDQPKDAQESVRRQARLIAEQILALTAALGATGPEGEG